MKLPKKIKIGYRDFSVSDLTPEEGVHLRGRIENHRRIISIDPKLEEDEKVEVLLHEIIHGVWDECDLGDHCEEEKAVTLLARGLTTVLVGNPELVKFINSGLKEKTNG